MFSECADTSDFYTSHHKRQISCRLTFSVCIKQIPDLQKELVDLKSPSAEDVSRVLDSYQSQVRSQEASHLHKHVA